MRGVEGIFFGQERRRGYTDWCLIPAWKPGSVKVRVISVAENVSTLSRRTMPTLARYKRIRSVSNELSSILRSFLDINPFTYV
jgi:hypothetical protein